MKKFIITLSLLVIFLLTGNAQVSSSDSNHKGSHRSQNLHNKGDRHRKGIRLFRGHHHHGKDHAKSGGHLHHGRKGHEKEKDK